MSAYRFCLLLRMTRWVSWRRYSSACVPSGRLGGDNPQSRRSRSNAGRPEWRRPPGNRTWQTGPGYPEKSTEQLFFENCLNSLEKNPNPKNRQFLDLLRSSEDKRSRLQEKTSICAGENFRFMSIDLEILQHFPQLFIDKKILCISLSKISKTRPALNGIIFQF